MKKKSSFSFQATKPAKPTSLATTINKNKNNSRLIHPENIKGVDEDGRFYNSYDALTSEQTERRDEFYGANKLYWEHGGCLAKNDDEAMVGDSDGIEDAVEGLSFLDRLLADDHDKLQPGHKRKFLHAVDAGAGVGRITKHVLLKRYDEVRLVEGDEGWSKRSKVYLGRKRASRCTFSNQRLHILSGADVRNWGEPADLVWIQWTLQYLTDDDVVDCLRTLVGGLRAGSGVLVVKENRPFGSAREDRFQMDLPEGLNGRYDITRPDSHHRYLFQKAGLVVCLMDRGVETNTYALKAET